MAIDKIKLFNLIRFYVVPLDCLNDFIGFSFCPFLISLWTALSSIESEVCVRRYDMISVAVLSKGSDSTPAMPTLGTVMQFCMRFFSEDFIQTGLKRYLAISRSCLNSLGGNERASDKVEFVDVSNPFGVFFVSFLSLDGFDIFKMYKADFFFILEIIKNRNPIFSGGFHTYMITIILD